MAYKELKLEPGEAKDLYNLINAGMEGPKKKPVKGKKGTTKKATSKKVKK